MLAVIEPHVAVDVQRPGSLGVRFEPLLRKQSGPFLSSVVRAQLRQLVAQATNFGHAVQPHQLPQLAGRFVLQLLDGLDAAERHVG